jgi:large subunit ribosomal protein L17
MRHRNHHYRLGRVSEHRTAMLRNLLVALFRHERVTTTVSKAKAVRGLADRMITLAKRDNLHARRQVLSMVPDAQVVRRIFDTIVARYADRPGGYTRILKSGFRPGDGAPLALLELVDRVETRKDDKSKGREKKEKPGKPGDNASGKRRKEKAAAAAG